MNTTESSTKYCLIDIYKKKKDESSSGEKYIILFLTRKIKNLKELHKCNALQNS